MIHISAPAPDRPAAPAVRIAANGLPSTPPVILALHDIETKELTAKVAATLRRGAFQLRAGGDAPLERGRHGNLIVKVAGKPFQICDQISGTNDSSRLANRWDALATHMTSPAFPFAPNKRKDHIAEIQQGFALIGAYGQLMHDYVAASLAQLADNDDLKLDASLHFPTANTPAVLRIFQGDGSDWSSTFPLLEPVSSELSDHFNRLPMCRAYRVELVGHSPAVSARAATATRKRQKAQKETGTIVIRALDLQYNRIGPYSLIDAMKVVRHKSLAGLSFALPPQSEWPLNDMIF